MQKIVHALQVDHSMLKEFASAWHCLELEVLCLYSVGLDACNPNDLAAIVCLPADVL